MKKILLFAVAAALAMVSCDKDDKELPASAEGLVGVWMLSKYVHYEFVDGEFVFSSEVSFEDEDAEDRECLVFWSDGRYAEEYYIDEGYDEADISYYKILNGCIYPVESLDEEINDPDGKYGNQRRILRLTKNELVIRFDDDEYSDYRVDQYYKRIQNKP